MCLSAGRFDLRLIEQAPSLFAERDKSAATPAITVAKPQLIRGIYDYSPERARLERGY